MDEFIKELDPGLDYIGHEINGDSLQIYVQSNREDAVCPYCGQMSGKVHSVYERSFQDLPVMGKKTTIVIRNRKFFCGNPECSRKTFAERFEFLSRNGKKTQRLIDKIIDISLNTSSVAAADILCGGIANVKKSTICNLLKKRYTDSGEE